ncbi:MAG: hypothetical protein AB1442_02760 [Nitrospirota bacterium]
MLSVDDLLKRPGNRMKLYEDLRITSDKSLTEKLTVCIPDMHLLERRANDDFLDNHPEYAERFLDFLDFLVALQRDEGEALEIIQLGDMFDLWQAKGNTNLIMEAYTDIVGLMDRLETVYVMGNHDIDIVRWYKDKGETFGRKWRHHSRADGKVRVIYEHGFQADFANNQETWSGVIGREIAKIVGMAEYVMPDIDIVLGSTWDSIVRAFGRYNVLTPVRNPEGFNFHEYFNFYLNRMEKYNRGEGLDHFGAGDIDIALSVIGHTHTARLVQMPRGGNTFYLMDCGSWVNGGHEIGLISGKEMGIYRWA